MNLQLSGTTAVVTGGSKGIGRAVIRTMLDEGMRVVSTSRNLAATGDPRERGTRGLEVII